MALRHCVVASKKHSTIAHLRGSEKCYFMSVYLETHPGNRYSGLWRTIEWGHYSIHFVALCTKTFLSPILLTISEATWLNGSRRCCSCRQGWIRTTHLHKGDRVLPNCQRRIAGPAVQYIRILPRTFIPLTNSALGRCSKIVSLHLSVFSLIASAKCTAVCPERCLRVSIGAFAF